MVGYWRSIRFINQRTPDIHGHELNLYSGCFFSTHGWSYHSCDAMRICVRYEGVLHRVTFISGWRLRGLLDLATALQQEAAYLV
jgi:hypothetical protein